MIGFHSTMSAPEWGLSGGVAAIDKINQPLFDLKVHIWMSHMHLISIYEPFRDNFTLN